MRNLLDHKLEELDLGILLVVKDLCHIIKWNLKDYPEHTLFEFLQIFFTQDSKKLSLDFLATPSVLNQRLCDSQQHPFYLVCQELIGKGGNSLEAFDNKKIFTFLKKYFDPYRPQKEKIPQRKSEIDYLVDLIKRRRKNQES